MLCFVSLFLVVSTNAVDILAKRIFEMTYYVSSGKLNHTYTLTHCCQNSAEHHRVKEQISSRKVVFRVVVYGKLKTHYSAKLELCKYVFG